VQSPPGFPLSERFVYEQTLGAGGMGIVFAAHDNERQETVALKTLRAPSTPLLYRLKHEFRTLAQISHPNLVAFHELFVDETQAFFTMELVRGARLDTHIARSDASLGGRPRALAHALLGLCDALEALHAEGLVHRDVKPSNVVVEGSGRVVLLDFGLVTRGHARAQDPFLARGRVIGTPRYMSPEQLRGEELTQATDFYGLGVLLSELLGNRAGPSFKPLVDLAQELCSELPILRARSERVRSVARRVLANLDHGSDSSVVPQSEVVTIELTQKLESLPRLRGELSSIPTPVPPAFVGRAEELRVLADALSLRDGATFLFVSGPSGIGKSALAREFVRHARQQGVTVLEGRCYEPEQVVFGALDQVIDALAARLKSLPLDGLLGPHECAAVLEVFPALAWALGAAEVGPARGERRERRDRAFASFARLIGHVADQEPLLLYIDDLQWADEESLSLLESILIGCARKSVMCLVTLRSDGATDALTFARSLDAKQIRVRELLLPPLSVHEVRQLVVRSGASHDAEIVHAQSSGNAFFATQLLAQATVTEAPRVEALVASRLAALSPEARALVRAACVAGEPLDLTALGESCETSRASWDPSLREAQRAGLLRVVRRSKGPRARHGTASRWVSAYHDKVRETVAAGLEPSAKTATHGRLAQALEARAEVPPELVYRHFRDAGLHDRARPFGLSAAERAYAQLAFDWTSNLCAQLLSSCHRGPERVQLLRLRADALSAAGHVEEAAEDYLSAARLSSESADKSTLVMLAAAHLLQGGHLARGLELARSILLSHGIRLPSRRSELIARSVLGEVRARLAPFAPPRVEATPNAAAVDACALFARGLIYIDPACGLYLQGEHLRRAEALGDPIRLSRANAFEALVRSARGGRALDRARDHLQRARELTEDDRRLTATCVLAEASMNYRAGSFDSALEGAIEAERMFREECSGAPWEQLIAQRFALLSCEYSGNMAEGARLHDAFAASAKRRGDVFAFATLAIRGVRVLLARDRVNEARDLLTRAPSLERSTSDLVGMQALSARTLCALYCADGLPALHLLDDELRSHHMVLAWTWPWPMNYAELVALMLNISLAVGAAEAGVKRRSARHRERVLTAQLARTNVPWAEGWAAGFRAALAHLEGRTGPAIRELERAETCSARAGLRHHAAAARLHRSMLLGNTTLRLDAEQALLAFGFHHPTRAARMILPGFSSSVED